MRVLIVEDRQDFYDEYLMHILKQFLPMEDIEFKQATTIGEAMILLSLPWDAVVMDFSLPGATRLNEDPDSPLLRNGADLIQLRRNYEEEQHGALKEPTCIFGMSSNYHANQALVEAGADGAWSKLDLTQLAQALQDRLKSQ